MAFLLCVLVLGFQFFFLLRMVMSFFPIQEGSLTGSVREFAFAITEPVVLPLRRRLPPLPGGLAGFGIAELMVLIGLQILAVIICRGA